MKSKSEKKVEKVMKEYKEGKLHSGSKKGPKVTSRKQAIASATGIVSVTYLGWIETNH
jgi:hypothetical protein